LPEAFIDLLADQSKREKMGAIGRQHVEKHRSWKISAELTDEFIKEKV